MKPDTLALVAAAEASKSSLPPPVPAPAPAAAGGAIVEYKKPDLLREEEEDLEIKLRRIIENVPVRVSNTSGSSAGSGSGDFHQVSYDAGSFRSLNLWLNYCWLDTAKLHPFFPFSWTFFPSIAYIEESSH